MQKDEKLTIRMSGGLRDLLAHDARRQDRSESYVVRQILEAHYATKRAAVKGSNKNGVQP